MPTIEKSTTLPNLIEQLSAHDICSVDKPSLCHCSMPVWLTGLQNANFYRFFFFKPSYRPRKHVIPLRDVWIWWTKTSAAWGKDKVDMLQGVKTKRKNRRWKLYTLKRRIKLWSFDWEQTFLLGGGTICITGWTMDTAGLCVCGTECPSEMMAPLLTQAKDAARPKLPTWGTLGRCWKPDTKFRICEVEWRQCLSGKK